MEKILSCIERAKAEGGESCHGGAGGRARPRRAAAARKGGQGRHGSASGREGEASAIEVGGLKLQTRIDAAT